MRRAGGVTMRRTDALTAPQIVAYRIAGPGYWRCVQTLLETLVLRDGHSERLVFALVTEVDHRGALKAMRDQLLAEHCVLLAETEALIDTMAAEIVLLKAGARVP